MKKFFKKLWNLIKAIFCKSKEVIQEIAEESAEIVEEHLKEELAYIDKAMEEAAGEELERLRQRAAVIHSQLLDAASKSIAEGIEELKAMRGNDLKD